VYRRVELLAEVARLSASGLHRLFRRHTQMTILDYIAQLRIGRACQLWISTSRPIAHIAADAGYDNLSHFNRQFKSLKEISPELSVAISVEVRCRGRVPVVA
jgi:AraC-like DNA-binding protein